MIETPWITSSQWAYLSNNLIYSAMVVYTLAMLLTAWEFAINLKSAAELVSDQPVRSARLGKIALSLTGLAFLIHLAGVVTRGISALRVPWGNMYEFSITGSVAVAGVYLLLVRKFQLRWLAVVVNVCVLLILGTAITLLYRPSAPLVPALKSTWLAIHVSAAIISGGVFLLANAVAASYLYLERFGDHRPAWAIRIPSQEILDRLQYRLIAFVFPLWTFAIIAGAIWAESAWGRYWGWDPKETWAFITWVGYAAYLHARATVGWRGRRAAWLCLIAGSTFLFNYVYVNVWGSGKHTYSGLDK